MNESKIKGCVKEVIYLFRVSGLSLEDARSIVNRMKVKKCFPRLIDCGIIAEESILGDKLFEFKVFDFYTIKQLSFFQRVHHYLRKIKTAALSKLGIYPFVVVTIDEFSPLLVNRAKK